MANKRFIGFRLRKEFDEDLVDALKAMDGKEVSELCRTGLRMALGIRTERVQTIQERPINMPKVFVPQPPRRA